MKKICLLAVFLAFCTVFSFGDTGDKAEEIDYLLFVPNSGNEFVDEARAVIQLDNLAEYLKGKDLVPGQVFVYGYAASFDNDIESGALSRERALFVINELKKRGVLDEFFSEAVGYGSVDLWGSNTEEEDRSPNRRVRIMVDGSFVTPAVIEPARPVIVEEIITEEPAAAEEGSKFPWYLLLLLIPLLALLIFLLARRKKKPTEAQPAAAPVVVPAAVPVEYVTVYINLDDEIRFRAFELYQRRGGQNGDAEGDWHMAVIDVCGRYEATGHRSDILDGYWHAIKTTEK